MSPKNLVLIAAAVAVFGMGVYLFIQVKSTPAQAQVQAPTPAPTQTHAPSVAEHSVPPVATKTPTPPTMPRAEARPITVGNTTAEPQAMAAPSEDQRANPKLDAMMELANKAYDVQDFDQAIAIAGKVLSKDPSNVRMLRVMVSANCIGGDAAVAQQYFEKLPKGVDREQMKTRCDRYQVTLKDQ